jgi:hypothetical protein
MKTIATLFLVSGLALNAFAGGSNNNPPTEPELPKPTIEQIYDIATNTDGTIQYMNKSNAISYCKSKGKRLPSARELAQMAQGMGARGITDRAEINGYYELIAKNADGRIDHFYFSPIGYKRSAAFFGSNGFWSSSISITGNTFILRGDHGYITEYNSLNFNEAALCVPEQ